MKTFRYGITLGATQVVQLIHAVRTLLHKPLSTTEGRRVALMNLGALLESGAIRSDDQKSGTYRRGWVPRRRNWHPGNREDLHPIIATVWLLDTMSCLKWIWVPGCALSPDVPRTQITSWQFRNGRTNQTLLATGLLQQRKTSSNSLAANL